MKDIIILGPGDDLASDDQDLLERLGSTNGMSGAHNAMDMDIRAGMCSAFADMAESVRGLLAMLDRHGFVDSLPDSAHPLYSHLMECIGAAARAGTDLVDRSRELDRDLYLSLMPEGSGKLH